MVGKMVDLMELQKVERMAAWLAAWMAGPKVVEMVARLVESSAVVTAEMSAASTVSMWVE